MPTDGWEHRGRPTTDLSLEISIAHSDILSSSNVSAVSKAKSRTETHASSYRVGPGYPMGLIREPTGPTLFLPKSRDLAEASCGKAAT